MTGTTARTIRLFISSPGDVAEERERARQVIQGLHRRYARSQLSLKPIFWEDLPLGAGTSFQDGIDAILAEGEGIDVALFILWSRIGSPQGEVREADGQLRRLSGTEHEFALMCAAQEQARASAGAGNGRVSPAILCYRRVDESSFEERLRGITTADKREMVHQREQVDAFFAREFNDAETATNRRAFHAYGRPIDFSTRLRRHLIDLLDPIAQRREADVVWDVDTQGPPYVGLAAFGQDHADVFFGREEETLEARLALQRQARNGCAFLLLSGASGSGKSSLAQAGILPAIVENELDEDVTAWRTLILSPSELGPHPIAALMTRICAADVLPELDRDLLAADFLETMARDPKTACALALKPAFQRLGGHRLLLVVDQLEELFVSSVIDDAERRALFDALEQMASTGCVWIVSTVRADFYDRLQSEPALLRMKAHDGQLDVLPPTADAVRRLVEEPAIRAGLTFERRLDGTSVSDLILGDAAAHPELLPLVEDLLRELYEARSGRELTFAAYDGLGGSVEKALAKRADLLFETLAPDEQAALPRVLEMLVTHGVQGRSGDEAGADAPLVRQWIDLSRFADDAPERRLIHAYVAARLFTAGRHPETGQASATVAHESLLRVWPRATDWAEANRDFLRTRASIARRFNEQGLLPEGDRLLGAARDQLARNPDGFSPDLRAFVEDSVAAAEKEAAQRVRRRRQVQIGIAAAILAIITVGVASLLYSSYQRTRIASAGQLMAEAQRGLSQRDYAHAEIAAARALTFRDTAEARQMLLDARSGGVTFVANSQQRAPGTGWSVFSRDGALAAALSVHPDHGRQHIAISDAQGHERWTILLPAGAGVPDAAEISEAQGGTRQIAIAWPQGSQFHVALWQLTAGARAGPLRMLADPRGAHGKRVPSLAFDPTGTRLATCGEDQKLTLWDYGAQQPQLLWMRDGAHDTAVHGIAFSRDGSMLASGGGDYKAKVWRVADMIASGPGGAGTPIEPVYTLRGHSDSVFAVAFSPDGSHLASGGYDRIIRVWDLHLANEPGRPATIGTLSGHEGTILSLAYSDDGAILFSGGKDGTVRVWDVGEGRPLVTLKPDIGVVRSVSARNFEDDIRIGGEQGWSAWAIRGQAMATRLWNGGATIGAIAFDPSGDLLAAGGNDGKVRVWDRSFHAPRVLDASSHNGTTVSGRRLVSADLKESINGVTFSPDGRWLAAAGEGYLVHVWDRRQGLRAIVPANDASLRHDGPIWGLCFDARTRWLATGNTDDNKRIRRWRPGDWSLLDESEPLADTPYTLACAGDGKRLVSGDSRGRVIVRETGRLRVTADTTNVSHAEVNVWSVALTQSPISILSGNSDGHVRRWIPNDRGWVGPGGGGKTATSDQDARVNPTINSVSVSQKHGWIAAGGDGATVEIYDLALKRIRSLRGHEGTVWFVSFDPAGARLAYGGTDRILRIFNLEEMDRVLAGATPQQLYRQSIASTGLAVDANDGHIQFRRRDAS